MTKILIVEDEAISALFLEACLEKLGYDVIDTVDNGSLAYQKCLEYSPDIVIMDIQIKGDIDGIETANRIYSDLSIPIIYLTAYSDNNTLDRAIKTGSFAYLLKPIEEKYLEPTIKTVLSKHQNEKKLENEKKWLNILINKVDTAIIATDINNQIRFINDEAKKVLGENLKSNNINIIFNQANAYVFELLSKDDDNICKELDFNNNKLHLNISKIKDTNSNLYGFIFSFNYENKNIDNQINICSFCKKIKDNTGKWSEIEKYIQNKFNILFSHGICIECTDKYYSDLKN